MKRRNFFGVAGTAALAVALPLKLAASDKQVFVDVGIGSNHGHILNLSIAEVIELFGETKNGKTKVLNIQGESGHPHQVEVSREQLVELLSEKELELKSTVDAGHSHLVSIVLEVLEIE